MIIICNRITNFGDPRDSSCAQDPNSVQFSSYFYPKSLRGVAFDWL